MANRRLELYNDSLKPPEVAAGINAASRNAIRLIEDAGILFKQGRWASVAAMAILSIEESGKIYVLRSIAVAKGKPAIQKHWKEYRSHKKKNVLGLFPELIRKGACTLEDFQTIFDPNAAHPHQIEQLKQLSMYTDCYDNANWSEPDMVIDEKLAEYLLKTAQIIASTHEVSSREIELWIEHMGPTHDLDEEAKKAAVVNWFAAMRNEGLFQHDDKDIPIYLAFCR